MKIALVTDAWEPQVNGVVRTLKNTTRELTAMGHRVEMVTPLEFRTLPCPTYPDIRLSLFPGRRIAERLAAFDPDAIHLSTEGPLGLAARRYAMATGTPFTTAYHTRFPEYVRARSGMPLSWTYAFLRRFHGPSRAVMAPTAVVKRDLESRGFRNVVLWSRGVDVGIFRPMAADRLKTEPPIFLYVGRVAVEKNIDAFLSLDLPGSKWVVGEGPALAGIRARHPEVSFLGVLSQAELAEVYASADVFVFPSRTDTFGLVLLEAMACGLPVAAYPVTGPLDVIGDSGAGAMHEDLRTACLAALELRREDAVARARTFSWRAATEQFAAHLYPRARTPKSAERGYSTDDNPHKGNRGLMRAWHAARNSWSGLAFAVREESAFRQELTLAAILVPLAVILPFPGLEKVLLIGSAVMVLIVELLNSSVEAAVDRISFEHHGLSKRAKDYGSAAVMLALLVCALTWATFGWQLARAEGSREPPQVLPISTEP